MLFVTNYVLMFFFGLICNSNTIVLTQKLQNLITVRKTTLYRTYCKQIQINNKNFIKQKVTKHVLVKFNLHTI